MKKKIGLIISVMILALSFAGCANKKTVEHDESTLSQYAEAMISSFSQMDTEMFETFRGTAAYGLDQMLYQSGLPVTRENFITIMNAWEAGVEECGAYIGHDAFEIEATAQGVRVTANAEFEDRDAEITFDFDEKLEMTNLTVSAEYSTGQIIEKAAKNTLIGMGTVFLVLIFISFLISLLKYIPNLQQKLLGGGNAEEIPVTATVPQVPVPAAPVPAESEMDDLELVAVITAAIAQAEGTTTDGFVVRSIKRRRNNKWNGGK